MEEWKSLIIRLAIIQDKVHDCRQTDRQTEKRIDEQNSLLLRQDAISFELSI